MATSNQIQKAVQQLNQTGEIPLSDGLDFLLLSGYLLKAIDRYVITQKWCSITRKLSQDELCRVLIAQRPEVWPVVLASTYQLAVEIVKSEDFNGLFELVNRLPKLAGVVKVSTGKVDIQVLTQLFDSVPDYSMLTQLLENIQKAEDIAEAEINPLGNTPDENWVAGRKVSTCFEIEETDNKIVLAPFTYNGPVFDTEIAGLLGNPWETFMVLLGMLYAETISTQQQVFAFLPQNVNAAREMQEVEVKLYTSQGREFSYGNLNQFGEDLAHELGLVLFPDEQPPLDKALFKLIEKGIFEYRSEVYRLAEVWVAKIYNSEKVLVNKSYHLRERIKEKLEKMRNRK
jgi:hypothetical protein